MSLAPNPSPSVTPVVNDAVNDPCNEAGGDGGNDGGNDGGGGNVEIFVAKHCPTCSFAYEVAVMIRHEFPAVHVRFIHIDDPNAVIPESVFATPTYLLDGHRWSLGNPSLDRVRQVLSAWHERPG